MKEGVDADYDNSLRMTADCVQETRALYDTIADKIRSTYEENKSMLQTDIPEVSSIAIPSLSMTVDLSPLNEDRIVKGENALDYLTKLRAVYKRVSSVPEHCDEGLLAATHDDGRIHRFGVAEGRFAQPLHNHFGDGICLRFLLRRSSLPTLVSRRRSSIRLSGMTSVCL